MTVLEILVIGYLLYQFILLVSLSKAIIKKRKSKTCKGMPHIISYSINPSVKIGGSEGYKFIKEQFKKAESINPEDIIITDGKGNRLTLDELQSDFMRLTLRQHDAVKEMQVHKNKKLTEDEEMNALIEYKRGQRIFNELKGFCK